LLPLALLAAGGFILPGAAAAPVTAEETPNCADCHDLGALLRSSVHGNAGLECASCHTDLADVQEFPHPQPAAVDCTACHDASVAPGHPPACADCHGTHAIDEAGGGSRPAKVGAHLSAMCGSCHEEIVHEYMEGIHGTELKKGNPDVPTCLTCHGGHRIVPKGDPNSPVNASALAPTCTRCHDDEEIVRKYSLPPARLQTFLGSFHGLAGEYGDRTVANCASCHGVHRILPSRDERSTINSANLPATCGHCHLQAGRNFAIGKVHLEDRWEDNPFTYVARRFYQGMIASMMAVFAVFMVADLTHRLRRRAGERSGPGGRSG